jgi:microcystin-dependent protein
LLSIQQNAALFSLLGTFYGGNGTQTFALPNLQGRIPIHQGQGLGLSLYSIGQAGGTEFVTLQQNQMPQHNHLVSASGNAGSSTAPSGLLLGVTNAGTAVSPQPGQLDFVTTNPNATMEATTISQTGGSQPHSNLQPYQVINFIICLQGIFPSRN